jgi:hypothetical protein
VPGDGPAALRRWQELVAGPAEPNETPVDWSAFEASIGLPLPTDYKGYIDTYGTGCINGLFWVRHPTTDRSPLRLVGANVGDDDPDFSNLLLPPPYPLGLGYDRLLLCADSEDYDQLFWHTSGDDPDRWGVVLGDSAGQSWEPYDMTMVEFLLAVFSNELDLGLAEAGYVGDTITFHPDPYARS